jgi:hypothetical protein
MQEKRLKLMIEDYLKRARGTRNVIRAAHFRAMADQLSDKLAVISRG